MLFRNYFIRKPNLKDMKLGQAGEAWVAYLYERKGFKILYRNYAIYIKKKIGELDLVCQKNKRLFFVEVKTRQSEQFMNIEEAISFRKSQTLRRMAKIFISQKPQFQNYDYQIDAALVLMNPVDNSPQSVKILENVIEDY